MYEKVGNVVNFDVRNKYRLVLPVNKSALYSKNCHIMAIKVFNQIPSDIKNSPIKQFKFKLKNWLIKNVFYTLDEFFKHTI